MKEIFFILSLALSITHLTLYLNQSIFTISIGCVAFIIKGDVVTFSIYCTYPLFWFAVTHPSLVSTYTVKKGNIHCLGCCHNVYQY